MPTWMTDVLSVLGAVVTASTVILAVVAPLTRTDLDNRALALLRRFSVIDWKAKP